MLLDTTLTAFGNIYTAVSFVAISIIGMAIWAHRVYLTSTRFDYYCDKAYHLMTNTRVTITDLDEALIYIKKAAKWARLPCEQQRLKKLTRLNNRKQEVWIEIST